MPAHLIQSIPAVRPLTRLPVASTRWLLGLLVLLLLNQGFLRAQDDVDGDPAGNMGNSDGLVTTAGCYDAYTGNVKRVVTDLMVPGSVGTMPLNWTRIYNSRLNAVPTYVGASFGDANWRHSYRWDGYMTTNINGKRVYRIGYPQGQVINFRQNRANAIADDKYVAGEQQCARGPAGTSDRLELNPSRDPANLYLHLADGTQVVFSVQAITNPDNSTTQILRADKLIDLNGATTTLNYGLYTPTVGTQNIRVLNSIVDPSGRSINLGYDTRYTTMQNSDGSSTQLVWAVISKVWWQQTSTGDPKENVNYGYFEFDTTHPNQYNQTTIYCALTNAYHINNSIIAGYSYYAANNPGSTGSAPPLLVNCDDPFFAGAMSGIHYTYTPATNYGVWGILQKEQASFSVGPGPILSTLAQDVANTPTHATETRSDSATTLATPITRDFWYGPDAATARGVNTTNARADQATVTSDFEGNISFTCYNAANDLTHGPGFMAKRIDPTGAATSYITEPYAGKITQTIHPSGSKRIAEWAGADGNVANPYFLRKLTDERGQSGDGRSHSTIYTRDTTTGLPLTIQYPDGSTEVFTYQVIPGPNGFSYSKVRTYKTRLGANFTYSYGTNDPATSWPDLLISINRKYAGGPVNGEIMTLHYNELNEVISFTDAAGATDTYAYNGRHQLATVTHSDGTFIKNTYDNYGNLHKTQDENGFVTVTERDNYRRVTSVTTPVDSSTGTTRTIHFDYDRRARDGGVIEHADHQTSPDWTFAWMSSGRGVERIFSNNGIVTDKYIGVAVSYSGTFLTFQSKPETVHWSAGHNALGQTTSTTDEQGTGNDYVTQYAYDTYNRLSTVTDPLGHIATQTYYAVGQRSVSSANAIDCTGLVNTVTTPGADTNYTAGAVTVFSNYDETGRPTVVSGPPGNSTASFNTTNSGFDAAGNILSQTDGLTTTAPNHVMTYVYDQLGRKSTATYSDGATEKWTYLGSGNLYKYTNRAGAICTYQYDARNRLYRKDWSDSTSYALWVLDAASRVKEIHSASALVKFEYYDDGSLKTETENVGSHVARTTT